MIDRQRAKRVFDKKYGDPPWTCYFCKEAIELVGVNRRALVRHHLNENPEDDRPKNLVPAHRDCHGFHHMRKVLCDCGNPRRVKKNGKTTHCLECRRKKEGKMSREQYIEEAQGKPWTPARRAALERGN